MKVEYKPMAILFVFLDGVGLAPAGPDNPLSDTPMPSLHELLGGPLVLETAQSFPHWQRERRAAARAEGLASFAFFAARNTTRFTAIDATLGVDGLYMFSRKSFRPFILVGVGAERDDYLLWSPT